MKDDPIISSLEATGLPPWNDGSTPRCPVCGMECETIYINGEGEAVGCDECLEARDAWDLMEQQE